MVSITSEDVAVQEALYSHCVCYPAHVATLHTLHTIIVCITFAGVAALSTLYTIIMYIAFADVAALYTLQSLCALPLQMWLHSILYIVTVCYLCRCDCNIYFTYTVHTLPLQMRLHLRQAPMLLHVKRTLSPADTM